MSNDVDLDNLASLTEGFCGADLQALVYNAHLEVVHTILPSPTQDSSKNHNNAEEVSFISSKKQQSSVSSKADKQALQRRVSREIFNAVLLAHFSLVEIYLGQQRSC